MQFENYSFMRTIKNKRAKLAVFLGHGQTVERRINFVNEHRKSFRVEDRTTWYNKTEDLSQITRNVLIFNSRNRGHP